MDHEYPFQMGRLQDGDSASVALLAGSGSNQEVAAGSPDHGRCPLPCYGGNAAWCNGVMGKRKDTSNTARRRRNGDGGAVTSTYGILGKTNLADMSRFKRAVRYGPRRKNKETAEARENTDGRKII